MVGSNLCQYEGLEEIQHTLDQLVSILKDRNMKINTEKTAAMNIKSKNATALNLKINDKIIPEVKTHKFLGMHLDNQLNYKNHIEKTKIECKNRTDIMKYLSNKHIGAHPSSLLNMYKGVIRSKLDYGSTIYGIASKAQLRTLDTIHLSGIKIALGLLKNTPSHAVLAESGELPLDLRRSWLAQKESIKMWSQSQSSKKYINNSVHFYNNQFNHKNLTFREKEANSIITTLRQLESPPSYPNNKKPENLKIHENIILNGRATKLKDYDTADLYKIYKETISTNFPGYQKIFTDGSKMESGVGFSVYVEDNNLQIKEKINDNTTILMAELKAIQRAVELAVEQKMMFTLILTDSQSSCRFLLGKKVNRTVDEIFEIVKKNEKMNINIQWIPGHSKIEGNEIADTLAKEATQMDLSLRSKITKKEAELLCKNKIWNTWNSIYKELSVSKGIIHGKIQKNVQKNPWFHGLQLSRNEIVILNRIRTNSGMTKHQKYKFKLEVTELCDNCMVKEDLAHILWTCKKYEKERNKIRILKKLTNLPQLLKNVDQGIYKEIAKFIKNTIPDF